MTTINNIKNWSAMSDPAIVKEVCNNIKRLRLNKNISQTELANLSGLNRVTISRLEAGRAATLLTIIQVLRALDKLEVLNALITEPEISPIQLLKQKEKQRQKASPRKR